MFTGIVQGNFSVVSVEEKPGLKSFIVQGTDDLIKDLKIGASISVDGACLTVAKIDGNKLSFDAMQETLEKTTIGTIKEGQKVNIERSASLGDEIGGHLMSGHIICTAEIVHTETPENNFIITFKVPKEWMKYIFEKGFIGLHGVSLTLVDIDKQAGTFKVYLIPETLELTNFNDLKVGHRVNVELDSRTQVIVETVEDILKQNKMPNK